MKILESLFLSGFFLLFITDFSEASGKSSHILSQHPNKQSVGYIVGASICGVQISIPGGISQPIHEYLFDNEATFRDFFEVTEFRILHYLPAEEIVDRFYDENCLAETVETINIAGYKFIYLSESLEFTPDEIDYIHVSSGRVRLSCLAVPADKYVWENLVDDRHYVDNWINDNCSSYSR